MQSPRALLEGYTDPSVTTLNETPIYMGGDLLTSANYALNTPVTMPTDNKISLFTGVDDDDATRQYGAWAGSEFINVAGKKYKSNSATEDSTFSPWTEPVLLKGTDGLQFEPGLDDDDSIRVFLPSLSRNVKFDFSSSDDLYTGYKTYKYVVKDS